MVYRSTMIPGARKCPFLFVVAMGLVPPLLSFLLVIVSGWVHRHQLIVIEFLQAENRFLRERLRGKRIRFTYVELALLAGKAKAVGRGVPLELESVVSPDTLMRWHRGLVAQKWTFTQRRGASRPGILRLALGETSYVRHRTENKSIGAQPR